MLQQQTGANDNLFGDGFFLGSDGGYGDDNDAYAEEMQVLNGFITYEADRAWIQAL